MALIIRSRYIKPNKSPCIRDCPDRKIGCHSNCQKYIEWKNAYNQKKFAIKQYNQSVGRGEEYEIIQKLKNKR